MAQKKDTERGTWMFYGTYKTLDGKRVQYKKRGFATKKEAKEAERLFRLAHSDVRPTLTLDELVHLYHTNSSSLAIKEATLYTSESCYRTHIKKELGKLKLTTFSVPFMDNFQTSLAKKKKADGTAYAPRTLNKVMDTLSRYFTYAVRLGYMEYNPCYSLPSIKCPVKRMVPQFWEPNEYKQFIDSVDDPQWKDIFEFMYGTGVREGELFALKWSDVDLIRGTVSITKTLSSKTKQDKWIITTPKTERSIRVIDLQDTLLDALRIRYKAQQKKDGFSSSWFVFGHVLPLSRTQLARFLDKYIELSGVPRITPHGFRHSHASLLIRAGIDDQLIADRLGHTPAELRKTYAHIYKESRTELVSKLNAIF